jgi:hypothetical protein
MKAECPNKCKVKRFVTTAHVVEDWEVDEEGNWESTLGNSETTHGPNPHNTWTCLECGAEATVHI